MTIKEFINHMQIRFDLFRDRRLWMKQPDLNGRDDTTVITFAYKNNIYVKLHVRTILSPCCIVTPRDAHITSIAIGSYKHVGRSKRWDYNTHMIPDEDLYIIGKCISNLVLDSDDGVISKIAKDISARENNKMMNAMIKYVNATNVIVDGPATITTFSDGSKVVVKRANGLDQDDPEKAIIMCILKKLYGETFHREIKRLNKLMADATSSAVERDRIKHRRQIAKSDKQTVARLKAEKIAQKQAELELFADDRRYPEIIDDDTIDNESIIPTITNNVKDTEEKYEAPYSFGQKRPYTEKELDVVYDKSLTAREAAKKLGRSVKGIEQYRMRHKIRTNRRGCHGKPFTEDEIILMEDPTIPSKDIAVTYGRNVCTVNNWRKRHGIKTERRKKS